MIACMRRTASLLVPALLGLVLPALLVTACGDSSNSDGQGGSSSGPGGPGSGPALRITPGVGLRFITPLGPARLDVAYNGYAVQPGRLYLIHPTGSLDLLQSSYQPPKRNSPWVLQLGVGQAF